MGREHRNGTKQREWECVLIVGMGRTWVWECKCGIELIKEREGRKGREITRRTEIKGK